MRRISDYTRRLKIRSRGGIGKAMSMKAVKAKPMKALRAQ